MSEAELLASMSPEELARTPAGEPPPGVVPNLEDPPSIGYRLLIIGAILLAIMIICSTLRLYSVIAVRRKIRPDDCTTFLAAIGACCYYVALCFSVVRGKFGTHIYNLSLAHLFSNKTLVTSFFTNVPVNLIWPCAKSSFLLMYLDLFRPLKWLRYGVYVGLFVTWGFYLSVFIAMMYYTVPPPGKTWEESFHGMASYHAFGKDLPICSLGFVLDVYVGFILDIYIICLPLAALSTLKLSRRKKIGVMIFFATGGVCVIASAMTIYVMHRLIINYRDFTYYVVPVQVMFIVEICVGVSASSMPALSRLFKQRKGKLHSRGSALLSPLRELFRTSSTSSSSTSSGRSGSSTSTNNRPSAECSHMKQEAKFREVVSVASAHAVACRRPSTTPVEAEGIRVDFTVCQQFSKSEKGDEYV